MYGTTGTQPELMQTLPFRMEDTGSVQGVLLAKVPEVGVGNSNHSGPPSR